MSQAYLGVGADRVRQFQAVWERAQGKIDLVILDDGFQNWKIHKDLEIVALTSARPGEILFRDHSRALKFADLIVWTKGVQRPHVPGKPFVSVSYNLSAPLSSDPLWLVTGIAHGESAFRVAVQAGYRITKHVSFGDHFAYHQFMVRDLLTQAFAENCKIALTGKDWVKWRELGVAPREVVVLEPQLIFEKEGKDTWSQILWGK